MPGAFGPILTTGVALSAAVVVVTNPVTAPHADVRIPAVQVAHTSNHAADMLDDDFIEALGPAPATSNNPLAVLKDLVDTLVANAADMGKSAVLHAFVAGTRVVTEPELTSVSRPLVPSTDPAVPVWPVAPGPVAEDLRPVVEQALAAVIADVGNLSDSSVLAAAFLAGAALSVEQNPIVGQLNQLVDIGPALDSLGSAVTVLQQSTGDAIRTVVQQYLPVAPSFAERDDSPSTGATRTPGVLALGGAANDDPSAQMHRRPIVDPRVPGQLRSSQNDADPTPAEAASPKRAFAGLAAFGQSRQQPTAPREASGALRGAISRAVKARTDRTDS